MRDRGGEPRPFSPLASFAVAMDVVPALSRPLPRAHPQAKPAGRNLAWPTTPWRRPTDLPIFPESATDTTERPLRGW